MKPLMAILIALAVLNFVGATMSLITISKTRNNEHAAKLLKLAQQPAPLPPMPANVVSALKPPMALPSPMPMGRFDHPSGMSITMPTNIVTIVTPPGYCLTNRPLFSISLEELVDFKRTNGSAVIWYFQRQ